MAIYRYAVVTGIGHKLVVYVDVHIFDHFGIIIDFDDALEGVMG